MIEVGFDGQEGHYREGERIALIFAMYKRVI